MRAGRKQLQYVALRTLRQSKDVHVETDAYRRRLDEMERGKGMEWNQTQVKDVERWKQVDLKERNAWNAKQKEVLTDTFGYGVRKSERTERCGHSSDLLTANSAPQCVTKEKTHVPTHLSH